MHGMHAHLGHVDYHDCTIFVQQLMRCMHNSVWHVQGDSASVEALEQQVATLDVQRSCTDEASTSAPDSPAVSQTRSSSLHRVKRFHKVLLEPVVSLSG